MRKSDRNHSRELILLVVSLIILFIYFSPYFIWGQDCLIRIGDNLDANIPYYKIIAQNAHEFGWSHPEVPQVMNGLPKASFLTQRNLTYLLFYIFPAFEAYVIHLILIALTAFFGMLLLLRKLCPDREGWKNNIIIYGVALCFSLLPFYPSAGISIAGQPFLFLAFYNINNGNLKPWNFIIIFLFPFYSSIVFGGVFYLVILGFWAGYKILFNWKNLLIFISAAVLLAISYFLTEQKLLLNFILGNGFVSIVKEVEIFSYSFGEAIKSTVQLLLFGFPAHANIFQFPVILFSILIAFAILIFRNSEHAKKLYFTLSLAVLFAVITGFYCWSYFDGIKERITFLKSFDFTRFSFLLPFVFYLLFFYSLLVIKGSFRKTTVVMLIILMAQTGLVIKRNTNNRTLYYKILEQVSIDRKTSQDLTYRQYYAENLFNKVKSFAGTDTRQYRIICLGIVPGVLLYNGFYTLDGYNSHYPIEYKMNFRKIIEKEIKKSESIKLDFDSEGSLCYLFSSELKRGICYTKTNPAVVSNLEINTQQINKMGGRYLISAVEIKNFAQNDLCFLHTFEDNESPYRIYLYKILQ